MSRAANQIFIAIDYGRPGGDHTVKCTSRLKTDGSTEIISMVQLETGTAAGLSPAAARWLYKSGEEKP